MIEIVRIKNHHKNKDLKPNSIQSLEKYPKYHPQMEKKKINKNTEKTLIFNIQILIITQKKNKKDDR